LWEKDAFVNERGNTACKAYSDGSIGHNMLVVYDGRVAGGWQTEMPDIAINVDEDSYESIINKTLSDPGVLATIERGHAYRFGIIDEVCPKACVRAKAVNIRDYTSPILLEEDSLKLYYTLRVVQDYLADGRVEPRNMAGWPSELKSYVVLSKEELRRLHQTADYDIVRQFEETEPGFAAFVQEIRSFSVTGNSNKLVHSASEQTGNDLRRLDKWRVLMRRIVNDWYDIKSLDAKELSCLNDVEQLIDARLLRGRRIYEGLSRWH
jgi:hypothetical protein